MKEPKKFYIEEGLIEKGVNAMYDEMIDKHIGILHQQPFTSSVQYFIEKGVISGSFLTQLRNLLKENSEICFTVQKKYANQHLREWVKKNTHSGGFPFVGLIDAYKFLKYLDE